MKTIILTLSLVLIASLTGCKTESPPDYVLSEDPLNLFNDNTTVMVEEGTDSDPLDLFTDEEDMTMTESTESFFEQKLACSEKIDDAKNFVTNELNYQFEGGYQEGFFEEIFYSPVQDSCLFAVTTYLHLDSRDVMVGYHLRDLLTTETLTYQVGCEDVLNTCKQTAQEAYNSFQSDLNSYKE